ncbi:hypothetical protein BaRGS_00035486 [Batillaria attramentaria]|uniref:Uncharacterized protein n=1 Tax=Batillaria attramentaria TaxID=370345 RepID=A0ABD0JEH0_9CAEN
MLGPFQYTCSAEIQVGRTEFPLQRCGPCHAVRVFHDCQRSAGSTELGCPIAQRITAQQTAQNVWTAATGLLSTLSCTRAAIRRRHTDMHDNTGSSYSNSVLSHARIPHSGNAVIPDYGLKVKTELAPRNLY